MNSQHPLQDPQPAGPHTPGWYEIVIDGHLDARWAAWFDGMTVSTSPAGSTTLRGYVVDQAALHGMLARLRDLGLPLLSLARVGDTGPDERRP